MPVNQITVVVTLSTCFVAPAIAAITYTDLYTIGKPAGFDVIDVSGLHTATGGQVIGSGVKTGTGNFSGLLWTPENPNGVDLTPTGLTTAVPTATDGSRQIGNGFSTGTLPHALLWTGTAASVVDLHPAGSYLSRGNATDANQQVGIVETVALSIHAFLWSGTAASAVDLHPATYSSSEAWGVGHGQQVGYAIPRGSSAHAFVWNGSATSGVDLHSPSFAETYALGTDGDQQIGYGRLTTSGQSHGLVWNGSAVSVIDVNPEGYQSSSLIAVSDGVQVGRAAKDGFLAYDGRAGVWFGSAESFIDLHAVLPPTYAYSSATSIAGNTIYGYGFDNVTGYHALTWTIPEPTSVLTHCVFAAGLILGRRRTIAV